MKLFFPRGLFATIRHLLFPGVYGLYKLGDNSQMGQSWVTIIFSCFYLSDLQALRQKCPLQQKRNLSMMALCSLWYSILLWVERWGQAAALGVLMPTLCWKVTKAEIKTQLSHFLNSQPPAFLLGKASLCPGYSWTSPTFLLYSLMYNYIWLIIFKILFICCTGSQLWHAESHLQHVGSSLPTRNQTWILCIGSMES